MKRRYIPHTDEEISEMLTTVGVSRIADLFSDLPVKHVIDNLKLQKGKSEIDVKREIGLMAEKNVNCEDYATYLGGGFYKHYVPTVISHLVGRGEFLTAYTPYQPEVSQGSLQMFYEFQTMIAELTGMEVANASMYDGGTAAAEAMLMSCRIKKKYRYLVSGNVHPEYIQVMNTYAKSVGIELVEIPYDEETGMSDIESIKNSISDDTAGILVGYPNFFGVVENLEKIREATSGIILSVSVNPIALGILEAPGNFDVDIVTGEGQPLGGNLYLGGMSLGLFACKKQYIRNMPGRIIGETVDEDGKRAFAMVLQTREQHIRRAKATSNICSNHAHNALVASVYLSLMGKKGIEEIALRCSRKAHYLAQKIDKMDRYEVYFTGPFFNEFVVKTDLSVEEVNRELFEQKIIGPLNLKKVYSDEKYNNLMMFAVTEVNTMDDINFLSSRLEELL